MDWLKRNDLKENIFHPLMARPIKHDPNILYCRLHNGLSQDHIQAFIQRLPDPQIHTSQGAGRFLRTMSLNTSDGKIHTVMIGENSVQLNGQHEQ